MKKILFFSVLALTPSLFGTLRNLDKQKISITLAQCVKVNIQKLFVENTDNKCFFENEKTFMIAAVAQDNDIKYYVFDTHQDALQIFDKTIAWYLLPMEYFKERKI